MHEMQGNRGIPKEPRASARTQAILSRIAEATHLLEAAENACREGPSAGASELAAAESAHYALLKGLRALTSAEVDIVEPAFTRFEEGLLRLSCKQFGRDS